MALHFQNPRGPVRNTLERVVIVEVLRDEVIVSRPDLKGRSPSCLIRSAGISRTRAMLRACPGELHFLLSAMRSR
jgi:hypothetical protein